MPPAIELSTETFARLQTHAEPLVDTIETVIGRLIDFYEAHDGAPDAAPRDDKNIRTFSPLGPPSLTHTKVLSIEFCGKTLTHAQTNWNALLIAAVTAAKARATKPADLEQLIATPFLVGKKTDEGYRHLPELDLSVQGQDANGAWKAACHIARALDLPLTVRFVWREKEAAAFPGIVGQFVITGR